MENRGINTGDIVVVSRSERRLAGGVALVPESDALQLAGDADVAFQPDAAAAVRGHLRRTGAGGRQRRRRRRRRRRRQLEHRVAALRHHR